VSASETLKALAVQSGHVNSPVATATYTINSGNAALPAPTFSVAGGTYTTSLTVTLSDSVSGATIYYTTNGTTPTAASTKYTAAQIGGGVNVTATETLKAIAVETGHANSPVASATYTINALSTLTAPVFSVPSGTYTTTQSVTIGDATSGATIYYTTNGTAPTTSSTKYAGAIAVSTTETLEAIAVETGHTNSPVATAKYTINTATSTAALPAPTFSIAGGTYTSSLTVAISDSASGATIYFTTNGTTPTTASTKYTPAQFGGGVNVSTTETLRAIAIQTGHTNSPVTTATYTITSSVLPAVTFSPSPGTYTSAMSVTMSEAHSGAVVYYTTDGSAPTTSSTQYGGALWLTASKTLKAIAVEKGFNNSAATTAAYTIAHVLPTPTFSLATGIYTSTQTVTIGDTTAGTTLYYTTNGTTPTTSSTKYTGAITVAASETLQAIAVETGFTNSLVGTAAYTINSTLALPTFRPGGGIYIATQSVAIADNNTGATIYYTTNGTTPTSSSAKYTGPVTVGASETLKALAVQTGHINSSVATAAYSIKSAVSAGTLSESNGTHRAAHSVAIDGPPTANPGGVDPGAAQTPKATAAQPGQTSSPAAAVSSPATNDTPAVAQTVAGFVYKVQ
jgi:hypothetical protein